ncbi:MAG: glycosyltransferase [Firmicutes bacterium]|nr:glycosyltransferase [Bacillota bacterium]MDY5856753.1 glycosyltransferase [Anaerovoracaceae bacterium]
MNLPLVSIIIPVYNGSVYMRQAIDSALNQTYPNIEVIVVNDGSEDDGKTERIAISYGSRIKYFHKENGGVSSALNLGIKMMKGEYFSWLSHDDLYEPRKIEEQVLSLQGKAKCVSICNTKTIDKSSNVVAIRENRYKVSNMSGEEALMYITKYGANGCSLLIPKKAFKEAGLFNEELKYCQDILMWWKIFLSGYGLTFIDYIGVSYRVHSTQVTQTKKALFKFDAEIISDIVIPQFSEASKKDNNILYIYAWGEAKQGNFSVLEKCLATAKRKNLFSTIQVFALWLVKQYGKIRPFIRRMYYRIKLRMKTR